jgi:REP element-mobilizing transposase RayT
VISRGAGGTALFRDDDDRRALVQLLTATGHRNAWEIYAYCLMTTHYHVVLETRQANLGTGMQRVNSRHVRRFNDRWGRFGTLVSERYRSRRIESEEYLSEACRYVLLNPVRAGLCEHVAEWPWCGGRFLEAAVAELDGPPAGRDVSVAQSSGHVPSRRGLS